MYVILNEQEYNNIRNINNKLTTFRDALTLSITAKKAKVAECHALEDLMNEKITKCEVDSLLSVRQAFDDVVLRGLNDVTFK